MACCACDCVALFFLLVMVGGLGMRSDVLMVAAASAWYAIMTRYRILASSGFLILQWQRWCVFPPSMLHFEPLVFLTRDFLNMSFDRN